MIQVPQEITTLINSSSVMKNFRVHFTDGSLEDVCNDRLINESVTFDESICSQDNFKLGLCESPSISFEAVGLPNVEGKEIQCTLEIYCDSTVEGAVYQSDISAWVYPLPIGVFKIDDCKRTTDLNRRKIKAYGRTAYEDWKPDADRMVYPCDLDGFLAVAIQSEDILNDVNHIPMTPRLVPTPASEIDVSPHHDVYRADTILEKLSNTYMSEDSEFLRIRWNREPEYETVKYIKNNVASSSSAVSYQGIQFLIQPSDFMVQKSSGTVYPENPMLFNNTMMEEVSIRSDVASFIQSCNSYLIQNNVISEYANRVLSIEHTDTPNSLGTKQGMFFKNYVNDPVYGDELHLGTGKLTCLFAETYRLRPSGDLYPYPSNRIEISVKKDDGTYVGFSFGANAVGYASLYDLYEQIKDRTDMNGALEEVSQRVSVIASFSKSIELQDITVVDYEKSSITVSSPDDYSRDDLQSDVEGRLELMGKIGRFNRYGAFDLIDIRRNLGLYPSNTLYPGDDVYPAETNAGIITPSQYQRPLWYDDAYTRPYGKIVLKYTNTSNVEVTAERYIVEEEDFDPSIHQVYEVKDNWVIEHSKFTASEIEEFLDTMEAALRTVQYMPCEITLKGQPQMEVGDALEVLTQDDGFQTFIMERTLTGIVGLKDKFISKGE